MTNKPPDDGELQPIEELMAARLEEYARAWPRRPLLTYLPKLLDRD